MGFLLFLLKREHHFIHSDSMIFYTLSIQDSIVQKDIFGLRHNHHTLQKCRLREPFENTVPWVFGGPVCQKSNDLKMKNQSPISKKTGMMSLEIEVKN